MWCAAVRQDFLDQAVELQAAIGTVGPLPAGEGHLLQVAANGRRFVTGGCGDGILTFPYPGMVHIGLPATRGDGVQRDAR